MLRMKIVEALADDRLLNNRAVFNTRTTAGAQIHIDAARPLSDFYIEVAWFTFYFFKIRVGDQFYVKMPADLDQYRGDNSHRTVIGGKCLVQLGHDTTNGGRFFKKIDVVPGIRQIKGGLHARNPSAYDKNGTNYIFCHCIVLLDKV